MAADKKTDKTTTIALKDDVPIEAGTYQCLGTEKQECSAFATILRPDPRNSRVFTPLCAKHAT